MPKITISGVHATVDGSYDLDLNDVFNGNELHLIKKHAGVRVGEIGEAMAAGDYDLIVCLTKIAMDRSGKDVPIERLMEAKVGALQFEATVEEQEDAEEDDALPPANAPSGANSRSSETPNSGSGSNSEQDSTPGNGQPDTGALALPIGSASDRPT